jgi:hypothetical protein
VSDSLRLYSATIRGTAPSMGPEGELARRIAEYVRFVEDWNERVHRNGRADPEFDQYSSMVRSGLWSTRDEKGDVTPIKEAPVFFLPRMNFHCVQIDAGVWGLGGALLHSLL